MAISQIKQRLRAEDVEDLAVMAAFMQDSITRIADMAYDRNERTFMLAATRFRREAAIVDNQLTQVQAALIFGCIQTVQHRGVDPSDPTAELHLLTIATEPGDDTLYRIALVFEGGAEIRLTSDCLHCRLEDFGEASLSGRPPVDHFLEELGGDELGSHS